MSTNNWWVNKLGGAPASTQSTPAQGPPPSNVYRAQPGMPNTQVYYDNNQDQLISKAVSARHSSFCPNCSSGNYFAPQGTSRMRCYDCGYPIVQGGSGAGMPGGSGPATPAKQVNQGGGYNPGTIVDRMG